MLAEKNCQHQACLTLIIIKSFKEEKNNGKKDENHGW